MLNHKASYMIEPLFSGTRPAHTFHLHNLLFQQLSENENIQIMVKDVPNNHST